jgi:tRNA threonylcarbamoyladenosine biosynthesis protein TsaB
VLILALDTTTRAGSVAVIRDDTVIADVHGDGSRTHGERLPGEIERALAQAGVSACDLELLAVASGPGAFTGLRIGLAAAQGLAMVLGTPVIGVSALDALAAAASLAVEAPRQTRLVTWVDAGRGEVFGAVYEPAAPRGGLAPEFRWRSLADPIAAPPAAILAKLENAGFTIFIGDGAMTYRAAIEAWSGGRSSILAPPLSLAPTIARLGARLAARGLAGPPHTLQPLYVRRPDAEVERRRLEP